MSGPTGEPGCPGEGRAAGGKGTCRRGGPSAIPARPAGSSSLALAHPTAAQLAAEPSALRGRGRGAGSRGARSGRGGGGERRRRPRRRGWQGGRGGGPGDGGPRRGPAGKGAGAPRGAGQEPVDRAWKMPCVFQARSRPVCGWGNSCSVPGYRSGLLGLSRGFLQKRQFLDSGRSLSRASKRAPAPTDGESRMQCIPSCYPYRLHDLYKISRLINFFFSFSRSDWQLEKLPIFLP